MMQTLERCRQIETGKAFKRGENKKAFELTTDVAIDCYIYEIEKCVFPNAGFKRCDFLFVVPKNREINTRLDIKKQRAYYIECKGDDHSAACEQLHNAIDKTKAYLLNFDFYAYIVSSSGLDPDIRTNEFYKKIKRLIQKEIEVKPVYKRTQFKYSEKI